LFPPHFQIFFGVISEHFLFKNNDYCMEMKNAIKQLLPLKYPLSTLEHQTRKIIEKCQVPKLIMMMGPSKDMLF
jgi:hypothetical protein